MGMGRELGLVGGIPGNTLGRQPRNGTSAGAENVGRHGDSHHCFSAMEWISR